MIFTRSWADDGIKSDEEEEEEEEESVSFETLDGLSIDFAGEVGEMED